MIVPYEIAVKLNQLGFNGLTNTKYYKHSKELVRLEYRQNWNKAEPIISISAPTVSEALQDIRERKDTRIKFYVQCHYSCAFRNVAYQGVITNDAALVIRDRTPEYLTHPEAELSLLKQVVEYLIEKK